MYVYIVSMHVFTWHIALCTIIYYIEEKVEMVLVHYIDHLLQMDALCWKSYNYNSKTMNKLKKQNTCSTEPYQNLTTFCDLFLPVVPMLLIHLI